MNVGYVFVIFCRNVGPTRTRNCDESLLGEENEKGLQKFRKETVGKGVNEYRKSAKHTQTLLTTTHSTLESILLLLFFEKK